MTVPNFYAEVGACVAFAMTAIWTLTMGVIWMRRISTWTLREYAGMAGIITFGVIAMPAMIFFSWPQAHAQASATPNQSGNCNNYGNNNINCNTFNVAPPKLIFSQQLGQELLTRMPDKKKKVLMESVGGDADQNVASQIEGFLSQNGYTVERSGSGMVSPPPDHKITLGESQDTYTLVIAPSAQ